MIYKHLQCRNSVNVNGFKFNASIKIYIYIIMQLVTDG